MEAAQREHDVFHRDVARALAEAGDGVCATDAPASRNRVRDAEAEVLVSVNLDRLLEPLDHLLHDVADRLGRGAANRVGNRQRVHVPFGRDLLDDVEEAIELGPRGVDREEHRIETGFLAAFVVSIEAFIARSIGQP